MSANARAEAQTLRRVADEFPVMTRRWSSGEVVRWLREHADLIESGELELLGRAPVEHDTEAGDEACTCPYTDPSTWLSAASCGYGSGYEPGSMQEWNPDCPVHPASAPTPPTVGDHETEALAEATVSALREVGRAEHEVNLRILWLRLANKRIEGGVDWPGIARTLFRDMDRLAVGYSRRPASPPVECDGVPRCQHGPEKTCLPLLSSPVDGAALAAGWEIESAERIGNGYYGVGMGLQKAADDLRAALARAAEGADR